MNRTIFKLLIITFCLSLITSFSFGCGHVHVFDKKVVKNEYLSSRATCQQVAKYFYSCSCGDKGEETFDYGEKAAHDYVDNKFCNCGELNPDYYTPGLSFALINDQTEYQVSSYTGDDTHVIIPSKYNGKPITKINDYAFNQLAVLESVALSENLVNIGMYAFNFCTSLTQVIIPNSVTSIGFLAFNNCPIENATLSTTALSKIEKTQLKNVNIIGGEIIAKNSFDGCSLLENVVISDSVQIIEDRVFNKCSSLKNVVMSKNVTSIGEGAFNGCSLLTNIELPNGVEVISDWLFSGCTSLESIEIPNGVKSLGYEAFSYCDSLTEITLPDSVNNIGIKAFAYCDLLNSVSIGSGVTSINYYAFSGCQSLTEIVIPICVTTINKCVFHNCDSLQNIYCQASEIPSGWSAEWNDTQAQVTWGYNE